MLLVSHRISGTILILCFSSIISLFTVKRTFSSAITSSTKVEYFWTIVAHCATVKNALRIYCESRNKWFDFSFRSANRKKRFLSTLALERQFCGKNLFISELAGEEDDNLSDREYHSDYEAMTTTTILTPTGENHYSSVQLNWKENIYDEKSPESPAKQQKTVTLCQRNLDKLTRKKVMNTIRVRWDVVG